MEYFYKNFVTENAAILDDIENRIEMKGQKILMTAGCGSGKTFFMLSILSGWVAKNNKMLILTVPNSLQAEQNAKYEFEAAEGTKKHVLPVTGTSKNRIESGFPCYCSVYDLNAQILDLPVETLSNMVFVVDEAHQLQTAVNYRPKAIQDTLRAANRVAACGGTVIFMTGTPRRLEDCDYDETIRCIKVDDNGNYIPQVNFKDLTVLSRASKQTPMEDCVINALVSILEKGGHPIVRINDKKMISKISLQLKKLSYNVKVLTSADKTCALIDGKKRYLSDMYENVAENSILPDADCYLVTSVLETGTSITGILRNGVVVQDRTLTPVCVVTKGTQFDLDELMQFFARPRFQIDNAYLILNFVEDKSKQAPSFGSVITDISIDATQRMHSLNSELSGCDFDRSMIRSIQGEDERKNLHYDINTKSWAIDRMQIRNDACKVYDKNLYFLRGMNLVPALAEAFQISSESIHMESCKNGKTYEKISIGTLPAKFDQDVKTFLSSKKVRDSLIASTRPELSAFPDLYEFSKKQYLCDSGITISGNEILNHICKLATEGIFSVDQAINLTKKQYIDGNSKVFICDEANEKKQDPMELAASIAAIQLTNEPVEKRNQVLWYYASHYLGEDVPYGREISTLADIFDAAKAKKYTMMLGSHYFSAIYKACRLLNGRMDICTIMAQPFADTEEGALDYIFQSYYAELNTMPRSTFEHTALQSTAEYMIATNPGCYIPDFNFREQIEKGNKKIALELGGGDISFKNFDKISKRTLDQRDLTWIAYNMLSAMRRHMHNGKFSGTYNAGDILTLFKRIFSHRILTNEDGSFKAIVILNPRKKPYMEVEKDQRLKYMDTVLTEGSASNNTDTRKYAAAQAEAGLRKIFYSSNKAEVRNKITSIVRDMLHIDEDGEVQEHEQEIPTVEHKAYSLSATFLPQFYVDHAIQVLYAYATEHEDKINGLHSFMDLVEDGTYLKYCNQLNLAPDDRFEYFENEYPSLFSEVA